MDVDEKLFRNRCTVGDCKRKPIIRLTDLTKDQRVLTNPVEELCEAHFHER